MTSGTGSTAAPWRKSSYSGGGNQCVEVAVVNETQVAVRDSKNPAAGHHAFSPQAWSHFLTSVKRTEA